MRGGKKEFLKTNETKISLLSSVDLMGVSQVSALLYQACDHAWCFPNVSGPFGKSLEQKWRYCSYCHSSRWGGPQSRMVPSLPKECSAGAVSGRAGDVFPSRHSHEPGLVLQGRREPLLDRILMSNRDYIRDMLLTCGPEQSRECCLFMASSADLTLLYCL